MIRLEAVTKKYSGSGRAIISDIKFSIKTGGLVFLTGPSGAGKSTLIHLIIGDVLPTKGKVLVGGHNLGALSPRGLATLRQNLGVVFQDFRLLDKRSVFENVALAMRVQGSTGKKNLVARVEAALKSVELIDMAEVKAGTLSGGEQQRVAIARALVRRPKLILADEPTGNLDPRNTERVMNLLQTAHKNGATVLLATHDPALPRAISGASEIRISDGRLERVQ